MLGVEQFLPPERQFGTALTSVREPLVDIITDRLDESNDIIDPAAELSRPVTALWSLSQRLAGIYELDEEQASAVGAAMYRGLCFGFQLVDDISSRPVNKLAANYFVDISADLGEQTVAERIASDVNDYLESRPEIKSLLFVYLPNIAGGYDYTEQAELAAGLIAMLTEREQAEEYIESELGLVALRLFDEPFYNKSEEDKGDL